MATKDWKKDKAGWHPKGGIGWIYFYPKGGFRGKEDKYVLSISQTGGSNPEDRQNIGFETKSQAISFAKSYMRTH